MSRKYSKPNPKDYFDEKQGIMVLYPRSDRPVVGGINLERLGRKSAPSKRNGKSTSRRPKSAGPK